jgi:hypothetical protein
MKHIIRFAVAFALMTSTASVAAAQNALQLAAGCAPRAATLPPPIDALRLIGAQDSVARQLFGSGDLVIIGGGLARGVALGQQFFVRRPAALGGGSRRGPRAVTTSGWIRVVAVDDTTAIALVDFACDGMLAGDHLEAYVAPALPLDANRTDTQGEPDFSAPGRLLFGDNERTAGATGDFMVTDIGETRGAAPGMRFAIYRNVNVPGLPLAVVGEAIVVFADPETSVVRLTRTRDAIYSGDLLIPRRR